MGELANFKDKNEGDFTRQRKAYGKRGIGGLKEHRLFWGKEGQEELGVARNMASVWAVMGDEAA